MANLITELTLPAPAKINLFLHITGRRPDGYHTLQTAFQFLDYCDELHFHLRSADTQLHVTDTTNLILAHDNLVLRAAKLLQEVTQTDLGADITLNKKLPIGGGLGGGSSDAATTLLALNQLWQTQLSITELSAIGLKLGADVPIFVYGHAAWAEGIGELLTAKDFPELWYLVLTPNCQVISKEIYAAPQLTRNTSPITISEFLAQGGRNDFTPVVRSHYPEVAEALDWLTQFADAKLTGSGACVFAMFSDKQRALNIAKKTPSIFTSFIAKGLNISPLHLTLDKML